MAINTNNSPVKLHYLFEAEMFDGSVYKQNKEDRSIKFPPKPDLEGIMQGKSCMADIQEDVDLFQIKRFTLIEQSFFPKKYTVDLTDGHFEIDGVRIEVEGDRSLPIAASVFKLIYFRVHRANQTTHYKINKEGEPMPIGEDKWEDPIKYMIGWQTEINGKNYQSKILVQ